MKLVEQRGNACTQTSVLYIEIIEVLEGSELVESLAQWAKYLVAFHPSIWSEIKFHLGQHYLLSFLGQ